MEYQLHQMLGGTSVFRISNKIVLRNLLLPINLLDENKIIIREKQCTISYIGYKN